MEKTLTGQELWSEMMRIFCHNSDVPHFFLDRSFCTPDRHTHRSVLSGEHLHRQAIAAARQDNLSKKEDSLWSNCLSQS